MIIADSKRPAQAATWNGPNTKKIRPQSDSNAVPARQELIRADLPLLAIAKLAVTIPGWC
jgi:hypothetical protein